MEKPANLPVVAIGCNGSQYVWMRRNLLRSLQSAGHQIVVLAPRDAYSDRFADLGVRFIDVPMKMNRNPLSDVAILLRLFVKLRGIDPAIYLGFTAKPNIYGTLAASFLGIPVVNNIAGLGSGFSGSRLTVRILKTLYRIALARSARVFFQNRDDAALFTQEGLCPARTVRLIPGSGVNLDHFRFEPIPPLTGRRFRFLLIARMLREKGIVEFVSAARMLRAEGADIDFFLLGETDSDNPGAIPREQIIAWQNEGLIHFDGFTDDVRPHIYRADCIVLPSYYREGTPRALLEAGACGRPIITTDSVGCREAIVDGKTGFLCAPRDANDLARRMRQMVGLDWSSLARMGEEGRAFIAENYDERIVIKKYLTAIRELRRG